MSQVIRVGPEPERYAGEAEFFDGHRARPERVRLSIDETARALTIARPEAEPLSWPLDRIRELPDQAGDDLMVLHHAGDPLARLVMRDRYIEPRLLNRRRRAPVARRGRLMLWAAGAVASVALIVFLLVPRLADQLAVFVPPEGERALGEVTLRQVRGALSPDMSPVALCEAPEGMAALDRMRDRLVADMDLPHPLSLHVLDHDMVNAFTLPGGYVVTFRGLIEAAESPEELAAVLAHEIGHVQSRDPTRHALRSAGSIGVLGLIFGDFAGGAAVLVLVNRLISAQYSQEAEAAADSFAHEMLAGAGVPPSALGTMFERFRELNGEVGGVAAHFVGHPRLSARIAAAKEATPDSFEARPILSPDDWRALKSICE